MKEWGSVGFTWMQITGPVGGMAQKFGFRARGLKKGVRECGFDLDADDITIHCFQHFENFLIPCLVAVSGFGSEILLLKTWLWVKDLRSRVQAA